MQPGNSFCNEMRMGSERNLLDGADWNGGPLEESVAGVRAGVATLTNYAILRWNMARLDAGIAYCVAEELSAEELVRAIAYIDCLRNDLLIGYVEACGRNGFLAEA